MVMLAFSEANRKSPPINEGLNLDAGLEYRDNPTDGAESIVRLYADKLLNPSAFKAITMFELAGYAQESEDTPRRERATRALVDYLRNQADITSEEEMTYIASLLGDIPVIEKSASNYQHRLRAEANADDIVDTLNDGESKVSLSQEAWDNLRLGIDLPDITKLAKETNVESVIIMAARTLNAIIRSDGTQREKMKKILEAETFYAPLLDAFGLSAFEMALRSEANTARLIESGHGNLVEKARNRLAVANEVGLDPVINTIFGKVDEKPDFHVNACVPSGDVICFNESSLSRLTDGRFGGRLVGRIKTVGSLAEKMLHNPDYENALPQDVIGFTAVLKDVSEVADFFKYIYAQLKSKEKAGEIKLVNAPSKTQPISMQGTPQFVDDLKAALGGHDFTDPIHTKKVKDTLPEDTFQVIKVTFDVEIDGKVLPVEFQFMTKMDRYNARLGGASHIHYKGQDEKGLLGNVPSNKDSLDTINRRKADLYSDPDNITPIDNGSAERFGQALARVAS